MKKIENISAETLLTEEQYTWFANRIFESRSGRVIVKPYLIDKLLKIAEDYSVDRDEGKDWLIDKVYNHYGTYSYSYGC